MHIIEDIRAYKKNDPAARSVAEILLLYNGLHATIDYRIAHWLHIHGLRFLARSISQWSKLWTGIEIHPGAKIGKGLFIDHGMGIVIGETAEIGDNCTIYQNVTLGGTGKDKTHKRHPTIKEGCIVSSGAKVLGNITVGEFSKIGAGSVVLKDIPPHATVVGIPGRVVRINGEKPADLLPCKADPVLEELCHLRARVDELERKLAASQSGQKRSEEDVKE